MKTFAVRLLQLPVHIYRWTLSPLVGHHCRFQPSCSEYCLQALEKHGPLAGLWLTAKRLAACHPWSGRSGFDPVPETLEQKTE